YVKTVKEQVVAANFDYVFIMQSLNHDLNQRRLERYLTLAWQSKAIPVVLLTKADLVTNCSQQIEEVKKVATHCEVLAISAKTGYGLDALASYLKPSKTIVFLGSSGVGKSSLVNAIAQEEIMPVKEIREDDSRGRHTTSHRQLITLSNGATIIDTPGMRELGMWDVSEGVTEVFKDVEQYLGTCKFSNCTHTTEPGCAIQLAIQRGSLAKDRWDSYQKIKSEVTFVNKRRINHESNR
ncbi:MAG: ribosome small subunit-dependent GTPase A, partial [Vallitaleaceae bacterium]|nr:ribosome small subunit-dependent GTPase A [Vallitaleaceae bacterium]